VGEVVRRLAAETAVPVSIDTSKASVAERALDAGAEIVNDVTGLEWDPAMLRTVVTRGAGVCVMHMRGTPRTMQIDPRYDDVVAEIRAYLALRRDALVAAGVAPELMRHADRFLDLGSPILVGHSRKGFLGKAIERRHGRPATVEERDALTAATACGLAAAGVHVIRVHAVGLVRAALDVSPASR
jgi:dihydropteroate synthase